MVVMIDGHRLRARDLRARLGPPLRTPGRRWLAVLAAAQLVAVLVVLSASGLAAPAAACAPPSDATRIVEWCTAAASIAVPAVALRLLRPTRAVTAAATLALVLLTLLWLTHLTAPSC